MARGADWGPIDPVLRAFLEPGGSWMSMAQVGEPPCGSVSVDGQSGACLTWASLRSPAKRACFKGIYEKKEKEREIKGICKQARDD